MMMHVDIANDKTAGRAVERLFEEEVKLTGIVEYGLSWDRLMKGEVSIPPQGARFDLSFEGDLVGDRIKGTIKGVDYLMIRSDGRFELDIQASIITEDGARIALKEDGVLTPNGERPADLHLNMRFTTADERYTWLNRLQVWGLGTAQMDKGMVQVSAFHA